MSFYSEMAVLARQVLAEFGVAATLVKRAAGTLDPDTDIVDMTPVEHAITVAIMEQPEATLENSAVVHKQRKAFIAADGLTVDVDAEDYVRLPDGLTYKVVNPGPLAPAGVVVVYDAVLEA